MENFILKIVFYKKVKNINKTGGMRMEYGIRHSDKCSDKELQEFKQSILDYLGENKYKIRAFNSFGGQVRIYTGKTIERIPLKRRRRLIAWKDTNGQWKGDLSSIPTDCLNGSQVWERHSEPIKEKEYHGVFRTEWYSEDKEVYKEEREMLIRFLTKEI